MKLAFSTLGCPNWSLDEIINCGVKNAFAAIEFRGLGEQLDLPKATEFSPKLIGETGQKLQDAGLQASCMSSSVLVLASIVNEKSRRHAVATMREYIDLAHSVGSPYMRVFGGEIPESITNTEAVERAAEIMNDIGEYAQQASVTVVVETHDALCDSSKLQQLISLVNHPAIQVLWDIHHPYRIAGEKISQTMENLRGHVSYTHIKDSLLEANSKHFYYVPLGEGDIPIFEALTLLKAEGYRGFLTLEWEKRWHPELAEPEFIFPRYASTMQMWLNKLL